MSELAAYTDRLATQAVSASRALRNVRGDQKNAFLDRCADLLRAESGFLKTRNQLDIEQAPEYGLSPAATDRLRLTDERIEKMAVGLTEIKMLPEPVGRVIDSTVRPNGLLVNKVAVPLGVVFFIYESRPNVTVDAAALCLKSGNAVILRGGKEALHSNKAIYEIVVRALRETELPQHAVQLVETIDRDAVGHFLGMSDRIDVTIPRGGKSLIERVAKEAKMPVIKHLDGVCHVYIHEKADPGMAISLAVNSKCQRPGVCNAAETLLIDEQVAESLLPRVGAALGEQNVILHGCERTCSLLPFARPVTPESFTTEYLALEMSVRVVKDLHEAIDHIENYGSHHTETIITNDLQAALEFTSRVDSSAVMVNASTRFNDGGQFGLGAEIGISTDKFHARGPCGLNELCSYKYIVQGHGQKLE